MDGVDFVDGVDGAQRKRRDVFQSLEVAGAEFSNDWKFSIFPDRARLPKH